MKSNIYTLTIFFALVLIASNAKTQIIEGYSDLFVFDTRLTHVQGLISEEGNGNPIGGVIVTLSHPVTSQADGSYSLDSVPSGDYILTVFDPGCQYELYEESVFITGEPTQTINASLTPGDCGALLLIDWFTDDTLYAFADNIDENSPNVYSLSGNVNINNVLYFDGDIQIDDSPSLDYPEITGSCGFLAKNIKGYSEYWIKDNNLPFLYYAEGNSLKPQGWDNLLGGSFLIGGFNTSIGEIILDSEFDFVEVKAIAEMQFPISAVLDYFELIGEDVADVVDQMSGSLILSKTNGLQTAVSISGISANIGIVEMEDISLYFNTNTDTYGGGFTLNIPGAEENKRMGLNSTFMDPETGQIPVEVHNINNQAVDSMSFNDFIQMSRSRSFKLLSVGAQIEFVQGSINKIIVSIGTKIPLNGTGLFITEISGGLEDLATENWKILASVDIELGYTVPVLGSPVKLNDFGVEIQPWNTFKGGGEFLVFDLPVSEGYIEYNRPDNKLAAEAKLNLGGILKGRTYMSLIGGQVSGSGLLTINTPSRSKLPWYLKWAANKTIGTAQSDFCNQYFQSSVSLGWIKLAHKLKFGKESAPWFHYYLGKNLNSLHKIWKGEIDGKYAETFMVPENAQQLMVVAMDTTNPTLFDFTLQSPSGQIINMENAYYYEANDTDKQTIMSVLQPIEGEWIFMMSYEEQVEVHISITNQEPTFLASEPSTKRTRSNEISLDFTDYDDTLSVQVYYNSSNRHFNGRLIDEFRIINNGKLDFTWQNQDVPNGEYYIYCRIDDGYNPPYLQYAPGSIWVQNNPDIESPQNFTVVQEENAFLIDWDEPVSGSIIATTVYYKNISTGRISDETVYKSYSLTLADLKPGQEYQLWACFINSDGNFSEPSEKINRIYTSIVKNNPPYFTLDPDSNFIFVEGEQSQYQITANDADGDLLTFDLIGDTLGITLINDQLIWTPADGDRGVSDLLIVVTDGSATDTTYQQLVVYTPEQVDVDLAFSSKNLYEKDNMFVKISNFFCPDFYQPVILRNIRTQEVVTIVTRRVNDFEYYGQFGLSVTERSDISVVNGDSIEVKYTFQDEEYLAYAYYDSLPQPSDIVPPGVISDLGIEPLAANNICLKWTATGNDAGNGKAYLYDIRYAYEPINSEDVYFTAYRIPLYPYPSFAGEQDSLIINLMDLEGIMGHDIVYFSIKAEDEMQNRGGLSNSPSTLNAPSPTNVTAVIENVYQIVLNWDGPMPSDATSGLQHYNVFRKIDQGEIALIQTGIIQTNYTDDLKAQPDGTYQYAIQAIYDVEISDTVLAPIVHLERFVNVDVLLSLADTNDYQGIEFHMTGLDNVYTQQFSHTTNTTGQIALDNVFFASYVVSASKDNYTTLIDTITVTMNNHIFNLELFSSFGINDITAGSEQFFKIYPNPTDGIFTLQIFDENKAEDIQVKIYSIMGEMVLQTKLAGQNQYNFDLSAEPSGIYLIKVIKGTDQGLMKIIKN